MRSNRCTTALQVALYGLILSSCSAGPTERDLGKDPSKPLESVVGVWAGSASGFYASPIAFKLTLTQSQNGTVTGTGTMQEQAQGVVTITVRGSYLNQSLGLTFSMSRGGVPVEGVFQSESPPVVTVSGPLHLTGTNSAYEESLALTLTKQ